MLLGLFFLLFLILCPLTKNPLELGGPKSPSCKRRKLHRRKRKAVESLEDEDNSAVCIYSLPQVAVFLFDNLRG